MIKNENRPNRITPSVSSPEDTNLSPNITTKNNNNKSRSRNTSPPILDDFYECPYHNANDTDAAATSPISCPSSSSSSVILPPAAAAPPPPQSPCHHMDEFSNIPFTEQLQDRASWLVGLLIFQSCSGFILQEYNELLEKNMDIVNFLTMLVGAGGNAGNQACVRVIRGLSVGTLTPKTLPSYLRTEAKMTICISLILSLAGMLRALLFSVPAAETFAITISLWFIVSVSIVLGAALPLGMHYVGIDPAHSSTTIQVVMDILGVSITCVVCKGILESEAGEAFMLWFTRER